MNKTTFLQRFIANKVRFHRKAKDLSQEELSEKAGLGLKYINQLENLSSNLSIQTLEKVILALDMTPEEFLTLEVWKEIEIQTILSPLNA